MSLAKRLVSRDAILMILAVIVGFIGIFGLPQKIGIDTNQLVLGLLAATALELLVQRVNSLESVRDSLSELREVARPTRSADELFLSRSDPPAFDSIVQSAHEVWVAGKSLNGLLASTGSLILSNDVRCRFLIHDPSIPYLNEALASQSFANPSAASIQHGIESGLTQLTRLVQSAGDRIEGRLSSALLPNGFTIVNPGKEEEWMRVELFSYHVTLASRRSICLSRSRDPKIYSFFFDQFIHLWDAASTIRGNEAVGREADESQRPHQEDGGR